jgi:hypothetical protein
MRKKRNIETGYRILNLYEEAHNNFLSDTLDKLNKSWGNVIFDVGTLKPHDESNLFHNYDNIFDQFQKIPDSSLRPISFISSNSIEEALDLFSYNSHYEHLSKITDEHVKIFSHFKNKRIENLNNELKQLQLQFKKFRIYRVFVKIQNIIANIKALAYGYISLTKISIKWAKKKFMCVFTRNLRFIYRHIIQFMFKNLDDESHSDFVVFISHATKFFTVNHYHHDFKRKSYYLLK